jgi:superfamily II DNA or RNA helicase
MIDFIYNTPKCAVWAGLGLGKTITTLTAITDLLDSLTVCKVLIIAPLRVANSVWHKEAANWQHTKHLKFSIVTGSEKERLAGPTRQYRNSLMQHCKRKKRVDHGQF